MRAKLLVLAALLAAGSAALLEAQGTPPRVFAWSQTLQVEKGQEIRTPSAVAAASDDELAVADNQAEPRLLRFRRAGGSWQLEAATRLPAAAIDLAHDGRRWVASLRGSAGLTAFEGPTLAARKVPVPRGLVPGRLAATPDGRLIVHDLAGYRLVELGEGGQVVREAPIEGHVTALAAGWSGGPLAALAAEGRIERFDESWRPAASWELPADDAVPVWPVALAVEPGGGVVVLDRHGGRILLLGPDGRWTGAASRRGWEPGLLMLPAGLARLADGSLVVADQGNGRVQIFRRLPGGASE